MTNVKLIRLITGQYIIGGLSHPRSEQSLLLLEKFGLPDQHEVVEDFETYRLEKPAEVVFGPDPATNRMSVTLMPFMFFTKDITFDIAVSHVLTVSEPDTPLLNVYNTQFGSGILVPQVGLSSDALLK